MNELYLSATLGVTIEANNILIKKVISQPTLININHAF